MSTNSRICFDVIIINDLIIEFMEYYSFNLIAFNGSVIDLTQIGIIDNGECKCQIFLINSMKEKHVLTIVTLFVACISTCYCSRLFCIASVFGIFGVCYMKWVL